MRRVAVPAERQDGLVLEEQHLVADEPGHSGRNEAMLQLPGIAVGGSAEPPSGKWLGCGAASLVRG